ncbi:hypothetical protein Pelo_19713 [Pelomyxa schiedti]|nr:hypothetical protein Pelo_19713 [Pelomyxa schiedti]
MRQALPQIAWEDRIVTHRYNLPSFLQGVYAIVDGTSCLVQGEYRDLPALHKCFCFGPSPCVKYIIAVRLADADLGFMGENYCLVKNKRVGPYPLLDEANIFNKGDAV